MAQLTTYAQLKTQIATWLDRDATEIDAELYITLAESHFWTHLRLRAMKTALSAVIAGDGTLAVPTGYREMSYAYVDGTPTQILTMKSPEYIYSQYPTRSAEGKPVMMAEDGDVFVFGPFPDSTYTVKGTYYAALDALSVSNESNWILANAPELYLFRGLMEGELWVGNATKADQWATRYVAAQLEIEKQNRRQRYPADMALAAGLA